MIRKVLIVCIGNDLVADDGVGPAIYEELTGRVLPQGTRLRLLGLGGMNLLGEFAGEELLIVVDAVQFGAPPGTVHMRGWDELPHSDSHVSCHGIGIREAIEVSRRLEPGITPEDVRLVGVEGRDFSSLGGGLSDEVARAVPHAVAAILHMLEKNS